MKRGFSVVELLIIIVLLGVLLGLGVVGMQSVQANARDEERKADIETIARGLEAYYKHGNPKQFSVETRGTYPGGNEIHFMLGGAMCSYSGGSSYYLPSTCGPDYITEALPGVSYAAITPPNKTERGFNSIWLATERNPVTILNDKVYEFLNFGNYVYKPMKRDSYESCTNLCSRYALIYRKETTGEVVIVRSKRQ